MASNYTEHYKLNQWSPEDKVLHTDFNEDNAKLEAALTDLAEKATMFDRVVPDLSYYTGQLALQDLLQRKKVLPQRSMLCEAFLFPGELTLTGNAVVRDGALTLPGAKQTGTMSTQNYSVGRKNWTTAKMWLRCTSGNENITVPYLNGQEMTRTGTAMGLSATGVRCAEREYTWQGEGVDSVKIKLELTSGSGAMSVYDYFVVFW